MSSIVQQIRRTATNLDTQKKAGEFVALARYIMLGSPAMSAHKLAEADGAPHSVVTCLRAAVSAGSTALADLVPAYGPIAESFLQTVAQNSVFEALRANGAWRIVPPMVRVGAVTQGFVASTVGEGLSKPVTRLTLAAGGVLVPIKCGALTVVTNELLRFSGPLGQQLLANELRIGLGTQIDLVLFNELLETGVPNQASAGSTAANAWTDIKYLLGQVSLGAASKPYFFGTPAALKVFATRATDVPAFPDLGPMGGEIVGIPTLPTDGLPAGVLALVDANAIAVADDGLAIRQSSQASLQLDSAPGTPPTGLHSLFQQNETALLAERRFAVQSLSSSSRAYISGVS